MNTVFEKQKTINVGGKLLNLSRPRVMGILNVTPDSFFDGGTYTNEASIKKRLDKMLSEGVDIIDLGGYSSRPGAEDISSDEEIIRLSFALEIIRKTGVDVPLSVDTFRSNVAEFVMKEFAVEVINDISGGDLDKDMYDVLERYKPAYVMMHMRGTPKTMSSKNGYDDMVADMLKDFSSKLIELRERGVNDVIIDPGFGFSKDLEQNYALLSQLHLFDMLGMPLLVGMSRKSMIYKLLDTSPQESLNGTTAVNMLALMKGASILRVHDVRAANECVKIFCQAMFR